MFSLVFCFQYIIEYFSVNWPKMSIFSACSPFFAGDVTARTSQLLLGPEQTHRPFEGVKDACVDWNTEAVYPRCSMDWYIYRHLPLKLPNIQYNGCLCIFIFRDPYDKPWNYHVTKTVYDRFVHCLHHPRCSMGLAYLPTKLGSFAA